MRKISLSLLIVLMSAAAIAQDELMDILNENSEPPDDVVTSTFKSTRLINGHSIETRTRGVLEFVISHRFRPLNTGVENFWGLDGANIRLGLEYGISDRLNAGVGRSSFDQVFDAFGKYKIAGQTSRFPVTVTAFASIAKRTDDFFDQEVGPGYTTKHRFAYTYQLLLARKMGSRLSLQLMPSMVHRNYVATSAEPNDLIAVGVGGRFKITNRVTINGEYYPALNQDSNAYFDAIAIGVDIETGGHVFQLHLTNAQQINERGFLGETQGDFFDKGVHFGFNISRVFNVAAKG